MASKKNKRIDQLKEQLATLNKRIKEYEKMNFSKLSDQEIRNFNSLRVNAELTEKKIANLQNNEPELGSEQVSHFKIVNEPLDRKINRN